MYSNLTKFGGSVGRHFQFRPEIDNCTPNTSLLLPKFYKCPQTRTLLAVVHFINAGTLGTLLGTKLFSADRGRGRSLIEFPL